ncbi:hypothetical protein AX774_g4987 [Zancudomyces culisetae]|uniref:Uncharacterized protein n=1 Tax=Zancudomyces culisetae TaxID=1213189 RepID=A0A1R1PKR8_ZANCU|nr:hypothetical protein AX774_g4987 [Zancudomyces culisetae]|eukprot:OMH81554.1 hypothetical protein AX774_g4987 [Zancudomyces culisetae]
MISFYIIVIPVCITTFSKPTGDTNQTALENYDDQKTELAPKIKATPWLLLSRFYVSFLFTHVHTLTKVLRLDLIHLILLEYTVFFNSSKKKVPVIPLYHLQHIRVFRTQCFAGLLRSEEYY